MSKQNLDPNDLRPISNMQHTAYRCRDAEQTRWFYEDVLGLTLAAALDFDEHSGAEGTPRKYMHLFFAMGDGNLVAFFDDPDHVGGDFFDEKMDGFNSHMAMEVEDEASLIAMKKRIEEAGITVVGPLDHSFAKSIYFFDPNGVQAELICKTDSYYDTMAKAGAAAHQSINGWQDANRAQKESLFGAEALDKRGRAATA